MAYVTRPRVTGGDRATLDSAVSDVRTTAERKGVELTGPHSRPPIELAVPQYRRSPPGMDRHESASGAGESDDDTFETWRYTVYERELEVLGRQSFVRSITSRELPDAVRPEVEVDRQAGAGR
ncbi:30S ribosomal protein S10 [Halobacteriales archaeon SW_5_70_135]|nr:MAG: 30S ribosomal protein S10 [Halobacteriales archaeon SW_5_70_135]